MTVPFRPLSPDEFREQRPLSPQEFRAKRKGPPGVRPDATFVSEPSQPSGPLHEMRQRSANAPTLTRPDTRVVRHERETRDRSGLENFVRGVAARGAETIPATMEGVAKLIGDEEGARRFAESRQRTRIFDPQGSAGQAGELTGAILSEGATAGVGGYVIAPKMIARAKTPLARLASTVLPTAPIDAAIGAANPRDGVSPIRSALENIALNAVLPSVVEGGIAAKRTLLPSRVRPEAIADTRMAQSIAETGFAEKPPTAVELPKGEAGQIGTVEAVKRARDVVDPETFRREVDAEIAKRDIAPDDHLARAAATEEVSRRIAAGVSENTDLRPLSARSASKTPRKTKDLTKVGTDALVDDLIRLDVRLEKNQRIISEEMNGAWTRFDDDMGVQISGSTGHWTQPHINRDWEALDNIRAELKRRGVDIEEAKERVAERRGMVEDAPVQYAEAIDMGTPFGFADPRVLTTIAGTGTGAATGAALDDENRMRGAVLGAGLGAGIGALSPSAFRGRPVTPGRAPRPSIKEWEERAAASLTGALPDQPGIKSRPGFLRLSSRSGVPPKPYMANPSVRAMRGTVKSGGGPSTSRHTLSQLAHQAYTRLVDEVHPLREFGRRVGRSEALSHEVSRAQGWRGAAEARLYQHLRPVLHAAKGHEDGVIALAKAERIIELQQAGKATDPKQLVDAQATVQALGQVPEVRGAVDQLRAYYRSLLDRKLANGVISAKQHAAIVKSGQAYTPLLPSEIADKTVPTAGGGKLANRGTGVRRMSDRLNTGETVDPFEQAVLDTYEVERTVAKQRVTNIVAGVIAGNRKAADPFVRKVSPKYVATGPTGKPVLTAPASKDGIVVTVNVSGKPHYYEIIDEELAKTWGTFDHRTQSVFVKMLHPFKRALQTGVTLLPDFAAANAIRDNAQAAIQQTFPMRSAGLGAAGGAVAGAATSEDKTRGALRGAAFGVGGGALLPQVARTLSAMRSVIGKDADYMEWLREGGGGFSEFYAKPRDAARMLARLRHDSTVWNTVRLANPLEFGRMVEEATRVGRYKAMRKGGAGAAEAAHGSRDVSLDFSTIGRDTRGIASVTAFFNAKVQGWDKLARLLKNPKTWAVGAATITAPTIALWDVNKDNPEYWDRPQWERNLFWLIPREEGGFYRVPKPFEIGYVFASLPERVLDWQHEKDPETLGFAIKDMISTTAEGTLPLPTALEPLIENEVNYDFFRNRPIVPQGMERLPDELQYDDRTSSLAVGIGKVTGTSPMKVDNTMRGYTGSAGTLALNAIDRVARATGLDKRPLSPTGRPPLTGRFVTREGDTSDAEQAIYRRYAKAEEAWAGARELAERGDKIALERFVRKHTRDLEARDELKAIRDQLVELAKAEREIMVAPGLSDQERREVVALIGEKQRQIAGQARRHLTRPAVASRSPAGSTP